MNNKFILNYFIKVVISTIVLHLASVIFNAIFIESVFYSVIGSILLIFFNTTIKPFFKFIMLPFNIITFGIFMPLVDVIILKVIGLFLGNHFIVEGWISAFFASIFISVLTFVLDKIMLGGRV